VSADFATDWGLVEAIKNLTIAKLDGAITIQDGIWTHVPDPTVITATMPRAYLSRTDSPFTEDVATVMTSWNGTHFGYTSRIANGTQGIFPGFPALVHFKSALFA